MHHKHAQPRLCPQPRLLLGVGDEGELVVDVRLQLPHAVHERGARVVDLVHDEDAAAEQAALGEMGAELLVLGERGVMGVQRSFAGRSERSSLARGPEGPRAERGGSKKRLTVEKSIHCVRRTSVPTASAIPPMSS